MGLSPKLANPLKTKLIGESFIKTDKIDATAIAVMQEQGLDLGTHTSKGLSELPHQTWDAIVTMGCSDACPQLPAKQRVDWQVPDPARQPREVYRQVRDTIDRAVRTLIDQLTIVQRG